MSVPAGLMLAFVIYFLWWAPRTTTFRFVGEAPSWQSVQKLSVWPAVVATSGDEYEGRDGAREASEDLQAGKVVLLETGLPYPWDVEQRELWARDYDVESRVVAGCIVSETVGAYVDAYNRVMRRHIAERFGDDVFDSIFRRAKALFEERHPKKRQQQFH